MASYITDIEFGRISVRRMKQSKRVTLRIDGSGEIRITMPMISPLFLAKRLINNSRDDIRRLKQAQPTKLTYQSDQPVGKSHYLHFYYAQTKSVAISMQGQNIVVRAASVNDILRSNTQDKIREKVAAALRKEAKSYLPRRLKYLAETHGFSYERVRFSHASTRWGSCSSSGTISLNIALMKLPFDLIDYVLLHELTHTVHMNHSKQFWALLETLAPNYKLLRARIKEEHPGV